ASVALLDAYGPANSRASSGGETRIIRVGYGLDELYTRWSIRSFPLWREFFLKNSRDLFRPPAVFWFGGEGDPPHRPVPELLSRLGVPCERLGAEELLRRYPQLHFPGVTLGVLEPGAGVLLARAAVQALVGHLAQNGVDWLTAAVLPPQ